MSSTGEPEYGRSTPAAREALFAPQPADREGYIAASEKQLTWSSRRYGSPSPDVPVVRDLSIAGIAAGDHDLAERSKDILRRG